MQISNYVKALQNVLKPAWAGFAIPAILAICVPSVAAAQASNEVTLRFADGQDNISGTLMNFQNDKFYIQASVGLVVIPADGISCLGEACPPEFRNDITSAAVVLTTHDGLTSIAGDLIGVTDGEYVLGTAIGEQRIAMDLVSCAGEGCPVEAQVAAVDQTVELVKGGITLRGRLLEHNSTVFLLDDEVMGTINVSAKEFECRGAACP